MGLVGLGGWREKIKTRGRYTRERSPISAVTGLGVEQLNVTTTRRQTANEYRSETANR